MAITNGQIIAIMPRLSPSRTALGEPGPDRRSVKMTLIEAQNIVIT
jgi:hypothetical protein